MEGWEGISASLRGMRRIRLPRGIVEMGDKMDEGAGVEG